MYVTARHRRVPVGPSHATDPPTHRSPGWRYPIAVIGLGKAYRDQTRAAEQTRNARTPRDERAAFEAPTEAVADTCGACGAADQVLYTEQGLRCGACRADALPAPRPASALPDVLLAGATVAQMLVVFGVVPIPHDAKTIGVWFAAFAGAGLSSLLGGLTAARGARHSPLHRALAAVHGIAALALGGLLVAILVASLMR